MNPVYAIFPLLKERKEDEARFATLLKWLKSDGRLQSFYNALENKKVVLGHFYVDYIRNDSVAAWMYQDVVPIEKKIIFPQRP